jgi:hypothetical protein
MNKRIRKLRRRKICVGDFGNEKSGGQTAAANKRRGENDMEKKELDGIVVGGADSREQKRRLTVDPDAMKGDFEEREIELEDGSKEVRKVWVREDGKIIVYTKNGNGIDYREMTRPKDPEYLVLVRLVLEAEKARGYRMKIGACSEPKGWCAMAFADPHSQISNPESPAYSNFAMSYEDGAAHLKHVIDSSIDFQETTRPEDPRFLEVCRLLKDTEGYGIPREAFPCSGPKGWCILVYCSYYDVQGGHWDTYEYPDLSAMSYEKIPAFLKTIIDWNKKR